jgi:hypothetical protein
LSEIMAEPSNGHPESGLRPVGRPSGSWSGNDLGNDALAWLTGVDPYTTSKHGPPREEPERLSADSHSGRTDGRARQIARTHTPRRPPTIDPGPRQREEIAGFGH